MKRERAQATTFRVMDYHGNSLNHVRYVESERPTDSLEIMVEKRKEEAERKRARWAAGYFINERLQVVPCDAQGHPV